MAVHPFALLSASTVKEVERQLWARVERWCGEWGSDPARMSFECVRAWEAASLPAAIQWCSASQGDAETMWFAWDGSAVQTLRQALFPSDPLYAASEQGSASTIALTAAREAMAALTRFVASTTGIPADLQPIGQDGRLGPAQREFAHGSGSIVATLYIGKDIALQVLLNDACVRHMRPNPLPGNVLAGLRRQEALAGVTVSLPVRIGQVELDIGSLLELREGDVIRLESSVDKPVSVLNSDNSILFSGYLSTLRGAVVLEVARQAQ